MRCCRLGKKKVKDDGDSSDGSGSDDGSDGDDDKKKKKAKGPAAGAGQRAAPPPAFGPWIDNGPLLRSHPKSLEFDTISKRLERSRKVWQGG